MIAGRRLPPVSAVTQRAGRKVSNIVRGSVLGCLSMELRRFQQRKQYTYLTEDFSSPLGSPTRADKLGTKRDLPNRPRIVVEERRKAAVLAASKERQALKERSVKEGEKEKEKEEEEEKGGGGEGTREASSEKRGEVSVKEAWKERREKVETKQRQESARTDTARLSSVSEQTKSKMTKVAFANTAQYWKSTERLRYFPHLLLILSVLTGTVLMLGSVGSNRWMEAQVNGLIVYNGLFERCVINRANDVTRCERFDWPGWLNDSGEEKMTGIKVMAILSVTLGALLLSGCLLLVMTASCPRCRGWPRRAVVVAVDMCLWLMVSSGGVSSLLFFSGTDSLQAYPDSQLHWPPVVYCIGWALCLLSRLVIAACCDVHSDAVDTSSLPFV